MKLAIGAKSIDDLLGGGIEAGALTEIYGEAGTGKTNLCLQLARNCIRTGGKVLFIDTEGISMERLEQLCSEGNDFETVARNLLVFKPFSMEEQDLAISKVIKLSRSDPKIKLIILDSATVFYRLRLGEEDERNARRMIAREVTNLLTLARKQDIPVVITTQVYTSIERNCISPLGGHALAHTAKTILRLERIKDSRRRVVLVKHRSQRENRSATFTITNGGIE